MVYLLKIEAKQSRGAHLERKGVGITSREEEHSKEAIHSSNEMDETGAHYTE